MQRCRSTSIAAVTGWGQAEDRRRTEVAGFDNHLPEPIDPAHLYELLRAGRE
jgi:CheY-like chemotaxis protein